MKPDAKLKTAMDETRLLILGAQILMGFQLNGMFQDGFDTLPRVSRNLDVAAFGLITLAVALLITPSLHHRIVERGEVAPEIHRVASACAGLALLPLAATLGLDILIVLDRHYGLAAAAIVGLSFFSGAMLLWFVFPVIRRRPDVKETPMQKQNETPLHAKVEQMLTEARVMIPGAQALLGFQMAVMLTSGFDKLPSSSKLLHTAALCCMGLAIILLIAPAAIHRLSFLGEDSEEFHDLGSRLIVLAAAPLAGGIALDLYVAATKATESSSIGTTIAVLAAVVMIGLWLAYPTARRMNSEAAP
ncbi:MAG: DUF6328 family protein [Pseudorhodoplanes sp.]|uniref:DUF6328 family protein n=1 Tax=Pseudorhodoplanes sp. TaxID=1934341 RepID=UPI003D1370D2